MPQTTEDYLKFVSSNFLERMINLTHGYVVNGSNLNLIKLLDDWGDNPDSDYDYNEDGIVDGVDLGILLINESFSDNPATLNASLDSPGTYAAQQALLYETSAWTNIFDLLDEDSQIMYVSNDGNDGTAQIYSKSDSEIGTSPEFPTGTIYPYETWEAAYANIRPNKKDCVLFARGNTFELRNGLFTHGGNFIPTHGPTADPLSTIIGSYGSTANDRPLITTPIYQILSLTGGVGDFSVGEYVEGYQLGGNTADAPGGTFSALVESWNSTSKKLVVVGLTDYQQFGLSGDSDFWGATITGLSSGTEYIINTDPEVYEKEEELRPRASSIISITGLKDTYQNACLGLFSLNIKTAGTDDLTASCIAINGAKNIYIEDCFLRGGIEVETYSHGNQGYISYPGNIHIYRSTIVDASRRRGGHHQGLFLSGVVGVTLEECVMDRNGYAENPIDPSTWSQPLKTVNNSATNAVETGTGVQPHRTWFSRNIYASSYKNLNLKGNILSRSASSHQMRNGGVAERNAFLWNDSALAPSVLAAREWASGINLDRNLVMHEDHLLAAALASGGMQPALGGGNQLIATENIFSGFIRPTRGLLSFTSFGDYDITSRALTTSLIGNNKFYHQLPVGVPMGSDAPSLSFNTGLTGLEDTLFIGDYISSSNADLQKTGNRKYAYVTGISHGSVAGTTIEIAAGGFGLTPGYTNADDFYLFSHGGSTSEKITLPPEEGERATVNNNVFLTYDEGTVISFRSVDPDSNWNNGIKSYVGSGNVVARIDNTKAKPLAFVTSEDANSETGNLPPTTWSYGSNFFNQSEYGDSQQTPIGTRIFNSLAEFQVEGWEPNSIEYSDITTLGTTLGWETTQDAQGRYGWDRDIVSYMESIDGSYVADENVTVDDGVPAEYRRVGAIKVWELLAGVGGGITQCNVDDPLSEADAKLTARRYHAFLTFIERARQNNRYNWDENYTADRLNDYIRSGLSMESVSDTEFTATEPEPLLIVGDYGFSGDYEGGPYAVEDYEQLTPSDDSKLFYISSTEGDDTTAAAVNGGLGYYRKSDSVIGEDPTNPIGTVTPYRTARAAMEGVTGSLANGGCDDWILFARGQTFEETEDRFNREYGFLQWGPAQNAGQSYGYPIVSGISEERPFVVTAWGDKSLERPVISGKSVAIYKTHFVWSSIRFETGINAISYNTDFTPYGPSDDTIIEDCYFGGICSTPGAFYAWDNIKFYRCQFVDGSNFFITTYGRGNSGEDEDYQPNLEITECIFDRNGFDEDVNDATTWTGNINASGNNPGLPSGTGVQPNRNYFKRNIYCANVGPNFFLRGNIFSRGAGGGSVQMRVGGAAEQNVFLFNEHALELGHLKESFWETHGHDGIAKSNLILHDDVFLPPGGWGKGITVKGYETGRFVVDDNIIAHFHRQGNGDGSIFVSGSELNPDKSPASRLKGAVITNNTIYHQYGNAGLGFVGKWSYKYEDGIDELYLYGNDISVTQSLYNPLKEGSAPNSPSMGKVVRGEYYINDPVSNIDIYWGNIGTSYGNNYHGNTGATGVESRAFLNQDQTGDTYGITFAVHQSYGYDTYSTFTGDFDDFKNTVGEWVNEERDIVSYMQTIDPEYTPDDDVTVDYGVLGATQATPQKVYDVLRGDVTDDPDRDAWALRMARRFHAAITFITRCRNQRRYSSDYKYTANSLNNYIRAGFGKTELQYPPVYGITNVSASVSSIFNAQQLILEETSSKKTDSPILTGFTGEEPVLLYSTPEAQSGFVVGGAGSPLWDSARTISSTPKRFKILFDSLPGPSADENLEELGFKLYSSIYAFTDPNSTSGVIDSSLVVNWMIGKFGSTLPDNYYLVLDFETPYTHNILYGTTGPGTDYQQTIDELVDLVEATKTQYPNANVCVYGIPFFPQWPRFLIDDGGDPLDPPVLYFEEEHGDAHREAIGWGNMTEAQRELVLSNYTERNRALMDVTDWFHPSAYDHYDAEFYPHSNGFRNNEYQYRYYTVEICRRYNESLPEGEPKREVLPAVSTMYWKTGQLEYNKKQTGRDELIRDQIRGLAGNTGCDGVAFWHALGYQVNVATSPAYPPGTPSYVQQNDARIAFVNDYFAGITPDWEGYIS